MYSGIHFIFLIASFKSSTGSLFNFCSNTLSPTASATVSENSVNFDTGGSTAAPGLFVSIIPPNEWAAAEIILLFTSLDFVAIIPSPNPG